MSKGIPCCTRVIGSPGAEDALVDLQNVGGGAEVYAGKTGTIGDVRTLVESGQVSITQSADELEVKGKYPQTEYCFDPITRAVAPFAPVAYFRFPGTAVPGATPTAIRALVSVNHAVNPGDIQLRDDGTGLIVASLSGILGFAVHVETLILNLADLAATPSVIAIDMQHINTGAITIYGLTIEF